MTSDAKVGLLLGLVFIFIIAFVINGLPHFNAQKDNNELTTNMVSSGNNSLGIAASQRKTSYKTISRPQLTKRKYIPVAAQPAKDEEIRFETALPKNVSTPANKTTKRFLTPVQKAAYEVVKQKPAPKKINIPKTILPRIYVIESGDTLASIALKFYGSEQGNRKINVDKIFASNNTVLESADQIYVGQKLIIPAISDVVTSYKKISTVKSTIKKNNFAKAKVYVVRDGDSLWKIASEQLGNGSRYTKLASLNAGIIDDEDNLTVGTRLKLPRK